MTQILAAILAQGHVPLPVALNPVHQNPYAQDPVLHHAAILAAVNQVVAINANCEDVLSMKELYKKEL